MLLKMKNNRPLPLKARFSIMIAGTTALIFIMSAVFVFYGTQKHFFEMDKARLHSKSEIAKQTANNLTNLQGETLSQFEVFLSRHPDMILIKVGNQGNIIETKGAYKLNSLHIPLNLTTDIFTLELNDQYFMGLRLSNVTNTNGQTHDFFLLMDNSHHQVFYSWLNSIFAFTIVISVFVSFILGWFITSHGLKPITTLVNNFETVKADSLKKHLVLEKFEPELHELVISFNNMFKRLDESFRQLESFSSDIAHELRTPVSNMITQTGVTLLKERSKNEYIELTHSNLEELNQLSKMIADMLFLAKQEHQQFDIEYSRFNVEQEIKQLLEYFEILASEKGMNIQLSGSLQIQAEQQMLKRALSNLISNAINYGKENSDIMISLVDNSDKKTITISNKGKTLTKSEQIKIFDRFYQTDPARRRGTSDNVGLGLAITRAIILAHNGTISCSSDNGLTQMKIEFNI